MPRTTIVIREAFEACSNGLLSVLLFLLLDNPSLEAVIGAVAIGLLSIDELLIMIVARARHLFDIVEMGFAHRIYALCVQAIRIGIVAVVLYASFGPQGRSFVVNLTLGCVPFAVFGILVRLIKLLDILMSSRIEDRFRIKGTG